MLLYNSNRAEPVEVIDLKVTMTTPDSGYWQDYALFELYIEGIKTDQFWFDNSSLLSADGRLRYMWDGRDAQGNLMPSGVYDYEVNLQIFYVAQYCGTSIFGGLADCVNLPTDRYTTVYIEKPIRGRIEFDAESDSPWGDGWAMAGMQRLYEDEAGRILIADGVRKDAFNFPQKNLLLDDSAESFTAILETLPPSGFPVQDGSVYLSASTIAMNWEANSDIELRQRTREEADLSEIVDQTPLDDAVGESDVLYRDRQERESASAPPRTAPKIIPPQLLTLPSYSEKPSLLGTLISGEISTDTVWSAGVYIVTGTVMVLPEVTLTIQPSVTVQFVESSVDLIIAGSLLANGTDGAPIIFQPQTGTVPGSWGQVAFLPGSSGILNHAELEYGGADAGMLYLESDLVEVLDSEIRHSADTGIVIHDASPTISGTRVLTNTGDYGGGVYNDSGSPSIENNIIQGNSADCPYPCYSGGFGGGIYNHSGNPTIENNVIVGNFTQAPWPYDGGFGGGIYNYSGSPSIQNNVIQGNQAKLTSTWDSLGGGIYNDSGTPIIGNNDIFSNTAYSGGGIYNISGSPIIQNNTFQGNSVSGNGNYLDGGGGLFNDSGGPAILDNTFLGNSSSATRPTMVVVFLITPAAPLFRTILYSTTRLIMAAASASLMAPRLSRTTLSRVIRAIMPVVLA